MKILVTGGKGFIASYLIQRFGKHEVYTFDSEEYFNGSFLKYSTIKFDYIFHLAAVARTVDCTEDPLGKTYESNVELTRVLLDRFKFKRFIYVSSCAIYGNKVTTLDESHPTNPPSVYAAQKLFSEQMVNKVCSIRKIPSVCLRLFNTYGPGQSQNGLYPNVISSMIKSLKLNNYIEVTGDGEQTRNFVYVEDVVDALILSMNSQSGNHIYNVGSSFDVKIVDLARMFSDNIKYVPKRDFDIQTQEDVISDKIMKEWGWIAWTDLETGIQKVKDYEGIR